MKINKLLNNINGIKYPNEEDLSIEVKGLACDFNKCQPDFLYAAFKGETVDSQHYGDIVDGRLFVVDAINKGATVILTDDSVVKGEKKSEVILKHPNPNAAFAKVAANFFENKQPPCIACVTGTNGKTSTVTICRQLWFMLGKKSASIGNLGTVAGEDQLLWEATDPFSVPDTVTLYEMLKDLTSYGTEYLAIEATSHALFEDRLAGMAPKIAAFTSFSRDHLDFHQTMEHYFNTKMKLFTELLVKSGYAVVNADMSEFEAIKKQCLARGVQVIGYGYNKNAELNLIHVEGDFERQHLLFRYAGKDYKVTIPFPGEYQVKNLLCAVGILMASGFNLDQIITHIPNLKLIPGRMQKVADYHQGQIFIDYAHTDDGLRMLLNNIKKMTTGKILLVFGAGGNRDQGKRALLGEVAATYADFIVITDDNPRTENPEQIRAAIAIACPGAYIIGDRKEAIRFALNAIQKNDVLVVAGKGTDNGQIVGYECLPFSDYDTIIEMVQAES